MADDFINRSDEDENVVEESVEIPSEIVELSDEDLDNMSDDDLFAKLDDIDPEEEEDSDDDPQDDEDDSEEESDSEIEDTDSEDDDLESDDIEEEEDSEEETDDLDEEGDAEDKDDAELDSTAKELFQPFKANGREISVTSVDEARKLMQMGANYNKKMANLKPHLKNVRVLEENKIDADELNLLIDVKNGSKEAVAKLLANLNIDPMDLDDVNENFRPKDHSLSDNKFELMEVSENLQSSPTYSKTVSVIENDLDEVSQKFFLDNPKEIELLNEHIASGQYDQVMDIVESQRLLGKLNTTSDIEAYVEVSQALQAQKARGQSEKPSANPVVSKDDDQRKARKAKKKAASSPKRKKSPKSGDSDLGGTDPLALSDDEFNKYFDEHLG